MVRLAQAVALARLSGCAGGIMSAECQWALRPIAFKSGQFSRRPIWNRPNGWMPTARSCRVKFQELAAARFTA